MFVFSFFSCSKTSVVINNLLWILQLKKKKQFRSQKRQMLKIHACQTSVRRDRKEEEEKVFSKSQKKVGTGCCRPKDTFSTGHNPAESGKALAYQIV